MSKMDESSLSLGGIEKQCHCIPNGVMLSYIATVETGTGGG